MTGSNSEECVGVTLSWTGRPEPVFVWRDDNGKVKTTGYLPRSLTGHIKRDANDWPLNTDGTKMQIYNEKGCSRK